MGKKSGPNRKRGKNGRIQCTNGTRRTKSKTGKIVCKK